MSDLIRMARAQCCPTPMPTESSNDAEWSARDPLRTIERQAENAQAAANRYLNRLARATRSSMPSISNQPVSLPVPHATWMYSR